MRFATIGPIIAVPFAFSPHVAAQSPQRPQGPRVEITVPAALRAAAATGRMYVFVTRHDDVEPRLQVRHESDCTPFFGVDVTQLAPGAPGVIDGGTLGYPVSSLEEIPAASSSTRRRGIS